MLRRNIITNQRRRCFTRGRVSYLTSTGANGVISNAQKACSPVTRVRVISNTCLDPWLNLAYEEYILEQRRKSNTPERQLMLWQNPSAVILGRNQNPWLECNLPLLRDHNIPLIRRQSGGGTVYHDLGNTNITIFAPEHKPLQNLSLIVKVLQQDLHLTEARISERRDVFIGDKKVSGSAYRITGNQCYHHMTMLINTDLDMLEATLRPTDSSVSTRATPSVRSKVINIKDVNPTVTHEKLCAALASNFLKEYPADDVANVHLEVSYSDLLSISDVVARADELKSWAYTWANTPPFTQQLKHSFSWGELSMKLEVTKGVIGQVTFDGKVTEFPEIVGTLLNVLSASEYRGSVLLPKLESAIVTCTSPYSIEVLHWFRSKIESCTLP